MVVLFTILAVFDRTTWGNGGDVHLTEYYRMPKLSVVEDASVNGAGFKWDISDVLGLQSEPLAGWGFILCSAPTALLFELEAKANSFY